MDRPGGLMMVVSARRATKCAPSGLAPDVSQLDPVPPVQALRTMAEDRLQALGSAGNVQLFGENGEDDEEVEIGMAKMLCTHIEY